MAELVLVIDAGTTNTKAALVNRNLEMVWNQAITNRKTKPKPGWVEQDPGELYSAVATLLSQIPSEPNIIGLGLTNQRETIIFWDKRTGDPLYPAIVWEDKRTLDYCNQLSQDYELESYVRETTGLVINPYFSASKIHWLIDHLGLQPTDFEHVACGTLDSWLIYKLTGRHLTDFTNASRTLLFNIRTRRWDKRLLEIFGVPEGILPSVLASHADFGTTIVGSNLALPITVVMGDQQASLYAAGNQPGTIKVTYGTGIFPMRLEGADFLLMDGYSTTLAVGEGGRPDFALEGKVENAAGRTTPALSDPAELARVVRQLAEETATVLRPLLAGQSEVIIDGGISQNDDLVAEQARLSGVKITRQTHHDGTILGVAKLMFDSALSS